jgi:hypothetical protein
MYKQDVKQPSRIGLEHMPEQMLLLFVREEREFRLFLLLMLVYQHLFFDPV